MKATGPSDTSTPKLPLSKSLKKARSKGSKSSKQATPQQPSSAHLVYNPASADYNKGHQRSYSGFGPKTVKVFWEQHDTSDTDVLPEVYTRLAEDTTYKVWDLINTIKTYARHSGGRVTCDVVNEVLKDSDVPPVLGSVDKLWNKIEYDRSFFFNTDEDVDLREEYLKDVEPVVVPDSGNISMYWSVDHHNSQTLYELSTTLCAAVFLGDNETFKYALDIAASAPHIACSFKLILKKCIDMLAFEQTPKIVVRCMDFLRSLTLNLLTRGIDCRQQLFDLAELFTCLLVGPLEPEPKAEPFEFVSEIEQKKEPDTLNAIDVDDIRNAYEALFQMMARDKFQEHESSDMPAINDIRIESQESIVSGLKIEQFEEAVDMVTVAGNPKNSDESNTTETQSSPPIIEYSPYKAEMIADEHLEPIYLALGSVSSHFGYFQNECTYLFEKRLEGFFGSRTTLNEDDYKKLSRIVRSLIVLGEHAFREILPYLHRIDPFTSPEWLEIVFRPAAIFLHGKDDIFLYEWMEALCGDKLQPFMLNLHNYLENLTVERAQAQAKPTFKIQSKVELKCIDILPAVTQSIDLKFSADFLSLPVEKKQINIKVLDWRPMQLKEDFIVNKCIKLSPREKFNKKVVIGKRKLFKSLTNTKSYAKCSSYCFLQL